MNVIDVTGLEKHYGSRQILTQVAFAVDEKEKVGLIGRNGCGKSTLLKILVGLDDADGGCVTKKRQASVVYLAQQPELDGTLTAEQFLQRSLAQVYGRKQRYDEVCLALENADAADIDAGGAEALLHEQQQLQEWFDRHRVWNIDHRIADLCSRLGVVDMHQPIGQLSGGQRKRVALAGVLLNQPDLLLLDEPTNHLDAESIRWLEEELIRYPGAVILVTHDRYFLDRVVGRMFELDDGQFRIFAGNYSQYLELKQQQLEVDQTKQSRLSNLLRREEAWLLRGAKARTTKQKARIDRVGKLQEQKKEPQRGDLTLQFSGEQKLGGTILELDKVSLQAGDLRLIDDLSLMMRPGERLGILGPNGSGKSTLLKTVLGEVPLAGGTITVGRKTHIGYIDQQRSGLDPEVSVAEVLGAGEWVTVAGVKRHKTGYLEDFLFDHAEQRKPVSTLSGGERARLLLALLMLRGANLLILDEPTNDLDIQTLQVLEQALIDFGGCVLIVTHDRYLLDRIATSILVFDGYKQATCYAGNFSDMCRQRQLAAEADAEATSISVALVEKNVSPRPAVRLRSGLSFKEKNELQALETEIEQLEAQQQSLEKSLSQPENSSMEQLTEMGQRFSLIEQQLHQCYDRWEELELKKEGA
ncbi:MAG: ABC-F family ATP-binding cassette domain-containing protein [Thermodesulfobacteriota bacterium]|nr:ABC-F family ATP-binding cassette domain-containing protein [Thermodesulfobacteriota bacterium]